MRRLFVFAIALVLVGWELPLVHAAMPSQPSVRLCYYGAIQRYLSCTWPSNDGLFQTHPGEVSHEGGNGPSLGAGDPPGGGGSVGGSTGPGDPPGGSGGGSIGGGTGGGSSGGSKSDADANGDLHSNDHTGSKERGAGGEDKAGTEHGGRK